MNLVHLAAPTLFICVVLLALFYILDRYYFAKEEVVHRSAVKTPLRVEGKINFVLLAAVVAFVLMSGLWKPGIEFDVFGTHVGLQNVVRDALLVVVTLLSLILTPKSARGQRVQLGAY